MNNKRRSIVYLAILSLISSLLVITSSYGTTQASAAGGRFLQSATSTPSIPENPEQLTFANLGFDEVSMRGPFDSYKYSFNVPANWQMSPGAEIHLVFGTFFTRLGVDPQSLAAQTFGGTLQVKYNDLVITTIELNQVGERSVTIPIPENALTPLGNVQESSLRLILDSGIDCDVDLKTTVIIRNYSEMFLPHTLVAPSTDLTRLPYPIFQQSFVPDSAVIVVPNQPTTGELQAAMAVAAGFGRMTFGGLQLTLVSDNQLTPAVLAAQHLIFVGKPSAFSRLGGVALAAPLTGSSFNFAGATPTDGMLQMAISPWNSAKVVLVISGNDDAAVIKSGQAFSTGAIRVGKSRNLALVSNVQPIMKAGPAAVDRTLADMAIDSQVVSTQGINSIRLNFDILSGLSLADDAYVELHFSHSALLEYGRSGMVVKLNGDPIGSVRLDDDTAGQGVARINLPKSGVRPGTNRLDLEIDLRPRNLCMNPNLEGLWMRIDSTSALHLPMVPNPTGTATYLDLSRYPSPFTLNPLMDNLAFVVGHDDPAGWNVAAQMASDLGDIGAIRLADLRVAYGDSVPEDMRQSYHLIIVGQPSKLPIVAELSDILPAPFDSEDLAIEKKLQVAYHIQKGVSVGYLELLTSPWNNQYAVLLVGGSTDQGVQWAGTALQVYQFKSQLIGNLAFINGDQVVAADTRTSLGLQNALATAIPGGVMIQSPTSQVVQRPVWVLPTLLVTVGLLILLAILSIPWKRRSD